MEMPANREPIKSYALNDVVHSAKWEAGDFAVHYQVRYTGADGDGTIYFRVKRQTSRAAKKEPDEFRGPVFGVVRPPTLRGPLIPPPPPTPETWEVRVQPHAVSDEAIAAAPWRVGLGPESVELHYYRVTALGVLEELETPREVPQRAMGFRAAIEEKPET
jgi:hypothetical protein